ncbi:hypothetical protein HYALB_00010173 [Hymenoscyphus albidus]|uniref:Uncharacterized protein n=1 Tax=Hymenoscyphus albidus TaxID=595503 RepID=A0A9N9PQC5_9HELO|nr:hypothetical protein HYALB_00010173 [Hymenoscyphus albidus]
MSLLHLSTIPLPSNASSAGMYRILCNYQFIDLRTALIVFANFRGHSLWRDLFRNKTDRSDRIQVIAKPPFPAVHSSFAVTRYIRYIGRCVMIVAAEATGPGILVQVVEVPGVTTIATLGVFEI